MKIKELVICQNLKDWVIGLRIMTDTCKCGCNESALIFQILCIQLVILWNKKCKQLLGET